MTIPTEIFLADDAATLALGKALTPLLQPNDLVLLRGDLGAGKTALARAIIRAWLGDETAEVPSPSFALVQPYIRDEQHLLHADLYRVAHASELDELGLTNTDDTMVLVEWPENAPGLEQQADVAIMLSLGPDGAGRNVSILFADPQRQQRTTTVLQNL